MEEVDGTENAQDRMACVHIGDIARLQPPKLSQSVHREECTQCFDNQVRDPPRTSSGGVGAN